MNKILFTLCYSLSTETIIATSPCPSGQSPDLIIGNQPRTCAPNMFNACSAGFSCTSSATSVYYCCSPGAVSSEPPTCPSGQSAELINGIQPRTCVPNMFNACSAGFSCTYSAALSRYYCCSSAGVSFEPPTCPNGQSPYLMNGNQPQTCVPNNVHACPAGFSCTYSTATSLYYCCSPGGVSSEPPTCPIGQSAELINGNQPRTCVSNMFNACSAGFSCTYSTALSLYYCCSSGAISFEPVPPICPFGDDPFFIGGTRLPANCALNPNGCPPRYICQENPSSANMRICCPVSSSSGRVARNEANIFGVNIANKWMYVTCAVLFILVILTTTFNIYWCYQAKRNDKYSHTIAVYTK